jgi:hypothetical protein
LLEKTKKKGNFGFLEDRHHAMSPHLEIYMYLQAKIKKLLIFLGVINIQYSLLPQGAIHHVVVVPDPKEESLPTACNLLDSVIISPSPSFSISPAKIILDNQFQYLSLKNMNIYYIICTK